MLQKIVKFQINAVLLNLKKYEAPQLLILIINASWAAIQHTMMISEGSCDTEDWRNDSENPALPSWE